MQQCEWSLCAVYSPRITQWLKGLLKWNCVSGKSSVFAASSLAYLSATSSISLARLRIPFGSPLRIPAAPLALRPQARAVGCHVDGHLGGLDAELHLRAFGFWQAEYVSGLIGRVREARLHIQEPEHVAGRAEAGDARPDPAGTAGQDGDLREGLQTESECARMHRGAHLHLCTLSGWTHTRTHTHLISVFEVWVSCEVSICSGRCVVRVVTHRELWFCTN